MSMATSLEKRLKAAVDALASGGSPKPVNVIRNSGDTPTPTVTYWTVTFADAAEPPAESITMPTPVQIEDKELITLANYSPDPSSGDDWEFDGWYQNGSPATDKVQITRDETFTAHYSDIVAPDMDPLPSNAAASTSGGYYIAGMDGASVVFSYSGNTLSSGTIASGYYSDSDTSTLPAVGTTLDITVSLSGYKDWTGTVNVTGGK